MFYNPPMLVGGGGICGAGIALSFDAGKFNELSSGAERFSFVLKLKPPALVVCVRLVAAPDTEYFGAPSDHLPEMDDVVEPLSVLTGGVVTDVVDASGLLGATGAEVSCGLATGVVLALLVAFGVTSLVSCLPLAVVLVLGLVLDVVLVLPSVLTLSLVAGATSFFGRGLRTRFGDGALR